MTIGKRIAQCRKQMGLSQEALGERVGVSRQAISKWESEQAIPELDKLLELTRVFNVTIGWLVCAEEAPEQTEATGSAEDSAHEPKPELTKELLDAYTAEWQRLVQEKRKPQKWPYLLAAVLVIALIAGIRAFSQLQNNIDNLEYTVHNLQNTTQRDIQGIASRVQNVLESYSDLTISADAQIVAVDHETDTITFSVSVLPKTYTEGMRVVFRTDSAGNLTEAEGIRQPDRSFSAEISCPLTDEIRLHADFITGDTTETKQLERYSQLRTRTFGFWMFLWPLHFQVRDGAFLDRYCEVMYDPTLDETVPMAEIASLEVALYEDGEKIAVYEPVDGVPQEIIFIDGSTSEAVPALPADVNGVRGGASGRSVTVYFRYPKDIRLDLDAHDYREVLTVTDVYGRRLEIEGQS